MTKTPPDPPKRPQSGGSVKKHDQRPKSGKSASRKTAPKKAVTKK